MSEEQNFWNQIKGNVAGPNIHWQRVESSTGQGIPDVNFCLYGCDGWMELKAWTFVRQPKLFTIPKLRDSQAAWLRIRRRINGRAFLVCRINKDVVIFDGWYALTLNTVELTYDQAKMLAYYWQSPPIDWSHFLKTLMQDLGTEDLLLLRAKNILSFEP